MDTYKYLPGTELRTEANYVRYSEEHITYCLPNELYLSNLGVMDVASGRPDERTRFLHINCVDGITHYAQIVKTNIFKHTKINKFKNVTVAGPRVKKSGRGRMSSATI